MAAERRRRSAAARAETPRPAAEPARDLDPGLVEAVRRGLSSSPRTLPPALLYDDLGSALFEAITCLPEYELTRADLRLLAAHAGEAAEALGDLFEVLELGPGGGRKAAVLLAAVLRRQAKVRFVAVDVSPAALAECRRTLEPLGQVEVALVRGAYLPGLRAATAAPAPGRRLALFLGSNLSNFDRREARAFLGDVRAYLSPEDGFLLATDLDKEPERLLPAYDDALGVTAAFNRNLLVRLNRDFGADFDLAAFAHEVRWSAAERRIEMHLRATRPCAVRVERLGLELRFAESETLWTESSHRFGLAELRGWAEAAGFRCERQWVDRSWPFAHSLLVAR
ncbi:MAG TPA: L-histidine N(alpha)-methyltransferase [Anaeromyxobacteraceae bacterium]|nr:L-histidine N(alpha)-methyltransferase [Anaeromyxobacteraceae bacterium]